MIKKHLNFYVLLIALFLISIKISFAAELNNKKNISNSKILITCFSNENTDNNNIKLLANYIQQFTNGNLSVIQTDGYYSYNQHKRDKLKIDYETIFIGFPMGQNDIPTAAYNLLEKYDLSEKTIIPFYIGEEDDFYNIINKIKPFCPNANISNNSLFINSNNMDNAQSYINKWLENLNIPQTMPKLNIKVGSKNFKITLYNNAAVQSLINQMPMTLNMNDLNKNEKYFYLPNDLPSESEKIDNINTGDFMLYGSDCIVLFYKDFPTSYNYTKLGYIENTLELAAALGENNIQVIFSIDN